MRVLDKAFKKFWAFVVSVLLLGLFFLCGSFFILLQGSWGRSWIVSSLQEALQESGWTFTAETIQGSLSEELILQNILIRSTEGDSLSIGMLTARLSLWRLLKREISFSKFHADQIEFLSKKAPTHAFTPKKIAYTLYFPHFELTHFLIPGQKKYSANLSGRLKIEKEAHLIYLKLLAQMSEAEGRFLLLMKNDRLTQVKLDAKLFSSNFLSSWISLPFSGSGTLHCYAKGAWEAFQGIGNLQGWIEANAKIDQALSPLFIHEWSLTSALERANQRILFSNLSLTSDFLSARGSLTLEQQAITEGSLRVTIQDLKNTHLIPIEGALTVQGTFKENKAHLIASSPQLKWNHLKMDDVQAVCDLERSLSSIPYSLEKCSCPSPSSEIVLQQDFRQIDSPAWNGSLSLNGLFCEKPLDAKSLFSLSSESLQFQDMTVHTPLGDGKGTIAFSLKEKPLLGDLYLENMNLHSFSLCDPSWPFFGVLQAHLFLSGESLQKTDLEVEGSQLNYQDLRIEKGEISAHLEGPFLDLKGKIDAELYSGQWNNFFLQKASFQTANQENSAESQSWLWTSSILGDWNGPAELSSQGRSQCEKNIFSIKIEEATGVLLSHPISLHAPTQFTYQNAHNIKLTPIEIGIASGKILFSFLRTEQETQASCLCSDVPLDLFSANPLEVEIGGTLSLDATIASQGIKTQGSLRTELNQIFIRTPMEQPLTATAYLDASLSNERLVIKTNATVRSEPLFNCSVDLPLVLNLNLLHAELLPFSNISGSLSFQGQIEEFLDFFNLGPNRLEGFCKANFQCSGTLSEPEISGAFNLENGRYENYFTGTELRKINADVIAHHHLLQLTSFSAQDGQKKGTVHCTGELDLNYQEHFPFRIDGLFRRINAINTQWAQTDLDGEIHISGNTSMTYIKGSASIIESDLAIPERIPISKPDLPVQFIHASKRMKKPKSKTPYPIFFDYTIEAPDSIFLSGRGLSSEWKGSVTLTGTAQNLEMKGRYDLLSGEFHFAGRTFKLSEGSLIFGGKPRAFPILNIAATIDLSNLAIEARLRGPLNGPVLSFRSTPSLPTGVVLSYLLFDEDLAELNALQAAQLMASLASLSQESPSLLERTRQALRVDRLRIVATPIGNEGGKTYALQVGKYVSRDILFSVSQGAQGDSTNLGVEVDLGKGFIFEAEAQQEQEQGKFTLKWNLNY